MASKLGNPCILCQSEFNEGYHSGFNSSLAAAASALREEAMKRYGFEAYLYNRCANMVRMMMRMDPANTEIG